MRILRDIKAIAYPSQICSILPFFHGTGDELTISRKGKVYAYLFSTLLVVSSAIFCTDVLFNARYYKILKSTQGDTEEINQTIETLFCIMSYTMIVVSCVYNRAKHCRTFKDIAKIDEYLEAGGFDGVYSCPILVVLLLLVSIGVIGVAYFYIHYQSDIQWSKQVILMTTYSLQMLLSCVFAIYLRIVLMNVTRRIEFVNQKLDEFTKVKSNENWRELSNLIEIFCKFRYITENINSVTGVALLFYMGYAFYTVTNQSYLAFSTLTTHVLFRKKFDTMGLSVAWVIAEATTMSVICSSCDSMASEGAWAINMHSNKVKSSPIHHQRRRVFNNDFLRESPKENAVFMDIKMILFILKAAGLLPIYEQVSSYEIGPPTKSNEFYSFFVRGVIHALTIFNLYSLFTTGAAQMFLSYSDTDNINKWIEILLCALTYSATVLICTKNAKVFLKIINEILKVDEDVRRQFGATLNNNCGFSVKFIVGIFICQCYLIILKIFAVSVPLTTTSYILLGFYALQNGLSTTFIVFAAALLRIVTMRFAYLNLILDGYTYTQQKKLRHNHIRRRVGDVAAMETFPEDSLFTFRMHNKLLRIYKSTNECCSLILVGYMGYAFYTITTTAYDLFVQITTQRVISVNVLQYCFAWLCFHTAMLALLSKSCGQATKEANTTSQILARVYGKSKEYQNIIDKFLTKSIKQDVQFTAYGFFVIDNSTLFKIFSAVTTYLVILIQFKQLEDSKMEDQLALNAE